MLIGVNWCADFNWCSVVNLSSQFGVMANGAASHSPSQFLGQVVHECHRGGLNGQILCHSIGGPPASVQQSISEVGGPPDRRQPWQSLDH